MIPGRIKAKKSKKQVIRRGMPKKTKYDTSQDPDHQMKNKGQNWISPELFPKRKKVDYRIKY